MKLDTTTYGHPLREVGAVAARAEAQGFDGWLTSEVAHDPFVSLAGAALATERMSLGTSIVVAFARNPMSLAYAAQDVQQALGDRPLLLGLGSQIKPHIIKRFSSRWPERPAAAMREYIEALRAIWACWNDGADLAFEGDIWTHRLMTPMFTPPPTAVTPRVWLAAVGPGMTRVAGEAADGLICHGFTTREYLTGTTLPAVEEGVTRVPGRARADLEVSLPLFIISGYTAEETAAARERALGQIGFYGSTPAYRPVLEAHGWGALQTTLHELSVSDGWGRMPEVIDEEVVDAFTIIAEPDEIGDAIVERFGGLVDRVQVGGIALRDEHVATLRDTLSRA